MEQNVKVKPHWGSPSLSLTTGLKTKCTQSEHMSAERDKTAPVAQGTRHSLDPGTLSAFTQFKPQRAEFML